MSKIGLVLEGGGMRGAYTAGTLTWLLDNNIEFNYGVGISSGAVTLCSYYLKNRQLLEDISVKYTADPKNVGIKSLFREGRYVGYDYMFEHILIDTLKYDISPIIEKNINMEVGLYDLDLAQTIFVGPKKLDKGLKILKACCSLPIAGHIVDYDGHRYLDGGIQIMIPYQRSIDNGNDKHLVIVTKPEGYTRKAAGSKMQAMMKFNYKKYPKLVSHYTNRHIAYNEQMGKIEEGVKNGNTLLIRPSIDIPVKRFSGDIDNLKKLFDLGYKDMENNSTEIYKFMNISKELS